MLEIAITTAAGIVASFVSSGDTTITLQDATIFTSVATPFTAVLGGEVISVGGVSNNQLTSCVRGVGGSLAVNHPVGTVIQGALTRGDLGSKVGDWQPQDLSCIAWTYDPVTCQSSGTLATGGTLYLSGVQVAGSATATKIMWWCAVAATTPTAGQNFVGIYNAAGNLLQSVGVDAHSGASGFYAEPITAVPVTTGLFWVGFLFNAATPPQLARTTTLTDAVHALNLNAPTSIARFMSAGTLRTALPATLSSQALTANSFWAAIG